MLLNKAFGVRQAVVACSTLTALLAFSGCSLFHHGEHEAAAPPPSVAQPETMAAPEAQTVTEAEGEGSGEAGTVTEEEVTVTAHAAGGPE